MKLFVVFLVSISKTYLCLKRVVRLSHLELSYVEPMEERSENCKEEIVSYFDESTVVVANAESVIDIKIQSYPKIVSNVTFESDVLAIRNGQRQGQDVTYVLTDDFVLTCKRRGNAEFEWRTDASTSFSSSSKPSHISLRIISSHSGKTSLDVVFVMITYVDRTTRASVMDTMTGREVWHRNRFDKKNENRLHRHQNKVLDSYFQMKTSLHIFSKTQTKAHEIHIVYREESPVFIICNGQRVWGLDIVSGQTLFSLNPRSKENDFPGTIEEVILVSNKNMIEEIQIVRMKRRSMTNERKRICPLRVRIFRDDVLDREFPLCTRADRGKTTRHILPRIVATKMVDDEEPNLHIFRVSRGLIQTYGLDTGSHVRTTTCDSVTWSTDGANEFPMSFFDALTISPSGKNMLVRGEHAMCILDLKSGLAVAHTHVSGFTSLSRPVHLVDMNDDEKLDFSLLTTVGLAVFTVTPQNVVQSMMYSDYYVLSLVLMTWCCMFFCVESKGKKDKLL